MFRIGNEYHRQVLLDFVGSKQPISGIIYGNEESNCIIVTSGGWDGEDAGYHNVRNKDGTWYYIGQGEFGDQNPNTKTNSFLTNGEKTILLFSARSPKSAEAKTIGSRKKLYRFEGIFEVGSWEFIIPSEGKRTGNKLVQYHLIPAENIFIDGGDTSNLSIINEPSVFYNLRNKLKNQKVKPPKSKKTNVVEYRVRSLQIKKYALERAKGICEYCNKEAPFIDSNGIPFLEVHHILKLADDGPDIPQNVAAICPNCHRETHYGGSKEEMKTKLIKIIMEQEDKLDTIEK